MTIAGIIASLRVATLPLFLRGEFSRSATQIGLFGALLTAVGIVVSVTVGAVSDRLRSRGPLVLFACAATAAGYVLLACAQGPRMLYAAILPLGHGAVASAQILAHGRTVFARASGGKSEVSNARLRSFLSVGFVLGPALGSALLVRFGARTTFMIAAAFAVLLGLFANRMMAESTLPSKSADTPAAALSLFRVLTYVVAIVGIVAGDIYRASFLSVFLHETFGVSAPFAVQVFSVGPFFNLLFMPLAGRAADRWGSARVLRVGGACGVAWMVAAATSGLAIVLASQVVYSIYVSTIYTIGLAKGHEVSGGRAGLGASLFSGAVGLASLAANLGGGWLADHLSLRQPFGVAAIMCLCGTVLLSATNRRAAVSPR
jgi:MFS transporter, SET family, sugar efflux transporter